MSEPLNKPIAIVCLFCLQQSEYGSSIIDFHQLTVQDVE